MRATIYRYGGCVTRSILRATEVVSVDLDVDTDDDDLNEQIAQREGDFIEIDTTEEQQ